MTTQPGEKHLHLLRCSILGFVENNKRIVKGSATHVGQGYDFDNFHVLHPPQSLGFHEILQRVVERAQIRVNLVLKRAGQETELLTGFDGGPGEQDTRYLLLPQCGNSHGHC